MQMGENRPVGETIGSFVVTSTGDKLTWTFMTPVTLIRWGFGVSTAADGAPVVALDRRILIGSNTGRVDAAGGTITPGTLAAGKVAYRDLTTPLEMNAGDQLVFEVTTASTSTGTMFGFVVVRDRPFVDNNVYLEDAVAFTA